MRPVGAAREVVVDFLHELGGIWLFYLHVQKVFYTTRGNWPAILEQIAFVSLRSLSTVAFAGVFVGAILVLQFNLILAKFDAQSFLGGLNSSSVVREVGPLIICFLLAGKIGAFTAAELGTMRVTEQIDAVECLGTNPVQYLVVPRFVGIVASSVLLLALGLLISVGGAMVVAQLACGINFLQFASTIPQFVTLWTVIGSLVKALVFGSIVGGVAIYKGFTATGGARGVGQAVTVSAVYTNLYIVVADYLTTFLMNLTAQVFAPLFGGGGT